LLRGIGQGRTGVLKVDGKEVATQKMEHYDPAHHGVGRDLRHRLGHRHTGEPPERFKLSAARRLAVADFP
jgi:hypothetical protein